MANQWKTNPIRFRFRFQSPWQSMAVHENPMETPWASNHGFPSAKPWEYERLRLGKVVPDFLLAILVVLTICRYEPKLTTKNRQERPS